MPISRQEPWGSIEYDPVFDEFEAHLMDEEIEPSIDRPISAGCLVTGRCNLHCPHCYGNREQLPEKELSAAEWKLIFARMRRWGLLRVDLSGGEPTLRRDIGDIARGALEEGLAVILSTNGMVFPASRWVELPKAVRLHVSFDSGFAPAAVESLPWLWNGFLLPGDITLLTSRWKLGKILPGLCCHRVVLTFRPIRQPGQLCRRVFYVVG